MDLISPEAFIEAFPEPRRKTVEVLRSIVRRTVPDAIEAVRPGWRLIGYRVPLGRRDAYFGYIAPEIEHVHLGFEYGVFMDDPDCVLKGVGSQIRYVTLWQPDEISEHVLEGLVHEAVRVTAMTRSERFAQLLDHDVDRASTDGRG